MSQINIKPYYDVVIIGAGMGGLTASAMLSKAGYSVVVLDAANQAGGYLAGFHRNRFRFDTAVHWLNQCNPGGIIHTVFETIGTDYPKVTQQKRIKRFAGDHLPPQGLRFGPPESKQINSSLILPSNTAHTCTKPNHLN